MDKPSIRERVEDVFAERLGVDALEKFKDDPEPFESAHSAGPGGTVLLDSLDRIEFIMAIEEEFGIEISDADANGLTSLPAMVAYLESRGLA